MSTNGTTPHRIKVTEIVLDSGIRVLIKPLVPYTRYAVIDKLIREYPNPNPKDFEEPIPGALSPGAVIPIDDPANSRRDEFKRWQEQAEQTRARHLLEFIIDECVIFPDFKERQALIDHFKDKRERLAKYMDLPADEWQATLYHCVLASSSDIQEINQITREEIELIEDEPTEDDVLQAYRMFRPRIQRSQRSRLDRSASIVQALKDLRGQLPSNHKPS